MDERAYYSNIRDKLAEPVVSLMAVCRITGLAYNTIKAIRDGTANPRWSTLTAIDDALGELPSLGRCDECHYDLGRCDDGGQLCAVRGGHAPARAQDGSGCVFFKEGANAKA